MFAITKKRRSFERQRCCQHREQLSVEGGRSDLTTHPSLIALEPPVELMLRCLRMGVEINYWNTRSANRISQVVYRELLHQYLTLLLDRPKEVDDSRTGSLCISIHQTHREKSQGINAKITITNTSIKPISRYLSLCVQMLSYAGWRNRELRSEVRNRHSELHFIRNISVSRDIAFSAV